MRLSSDDPGKIVDIRLAQQQNGRVVRLLRENRSDFRSLKEVFRYFEVLYAAYGDRTANLRILTTRIAHRSGSSLFDSQTCQPTKFTNAPCAKVGEPKWSDWREAKEYVKDSYGSVRSFDSLWADSKGAYRRGDWILGIDTDTGGVEGWTLVTDVLQHRIVGPPDCRYPYLALQVGNPGRAHHSASTRPSGGHSARAIRLGEEERSGRPWPPTVFR